MIEPLAWLVAREFDLGQALSCEPLGARGDQTMLLVTDRSSFVIKSAGRREWLDLYSTTEQKLNDAGVLQARLYSKPDGSLLSHTGFAVYEYLPGEPVDDPSPAQLRAVMRYLAAYNRVLASIPVPEWAVALDDPWKRAADADYLIDDLPSDLDALGLSRFARSTARDCVVLLARDRHVFDRRERRPSCTHSASSSTGTSSSGPTPVCDSTRSGPAWWSTARRGDRSPPTLARFVPRSRSRRGSGSSGRQWLRPAVWLNTPQPRSRRGQNSSPTFWRPRSDGGARGRVRTSFGTVIRNPIPGTPSLLPTMRELDTAAPSGLILALLLGLIAAPAGAQSAPRPEDTEIWGPVPRVVTPALLDAAVSGPSDAIVLFDGSDLEQWVNARDGAPAGWVLADGILTVNKEVGDIETRRSFQDFQIHIEWRVPSHITGEGQARGNSGLFLASSGTGYELQILDSFENATYVNGMAGSVYKQSIPLVNASRPPGEWQTYDVIWTAPRFDADGAAPVGGPDHRFLQWDSRTRRLPTPRGDSIPGSARVRALFPLAPVASGAR